MKIVPKRLLVNSRLLRKEQTPWETMLWAQLRSGRFFGFKFKRQFRLGDYIVDFYCAEKKLVIELDGGHHDEAEVRTQDTKRQAYLEKEGFKVLRFWNNEIEQNLDGVLEQIKDTVNL